MASRLPGGERPSGLVPRLWARWLRLSVWGKAGVITGVLIALCCVGVVGGLSGLNVGQVATESLPTDSPPVTEVPATEEVPETETVAPVESPASASPSPWSPDSPAVEKRRVTETRAIPYGRRAVQDPSLPVGTRQVRVKGVPGVKTLTYEVTTTDGVQTGKRLVGERVTRQPVTEVVAVGTMSKPPPEPTCDPNYSGCVPIASDVDCAGGTGDGPAYVEGPVKVIGTDIYRLDRDKDGIACDEG